MELGRDKINQLKTALKIIPSARVSLGTDSEALSLLIDLEYFLEYKGLGCLTEYQSKVLNYVIFEGYTETETGKILLVSQQAISYALTAALIKIAKYLDDPNCKPQGPVFTPDETKKLIQLYREGSSSKEIAIELNKKLHSVRNKIRYLRERGDLNVKK